LLGLAIGLLIACNMKVKLMGKDFAALPFRNQFSFSGMLVDYSIKFTSV
jgi:hypothetical protein